MTTIHNNQPHTLLALNVKFKKKDSRLDLVPLNRSVENVFLEAHNHIRDIDGLPQEEVIDELGKLMLVKYLDEFSTNEKKPYKLQSQIYDSDRAFASAIRALYDKLLEPKNSILSGDEIGNYPTKIHLSDLALVKVISIFEDYTLTKSGSDVKGRAFQKVISPASRAGMGQYFTPDPVVQFMVDSVAPKYHETVVDPFCGSAHFLTTASKKAAENNDKGITDSVRYIGIEKSKKIARLAKIDSMLSNGGNKKIICSDSLTNFKDFDFIKQDSFDIVLTNPPFGSQITEDSLKKLEDLELLVGKKRMPLEILGLERSIQLLKPGGRLAIVLPEGILSNRNMGYVRSWLLKNIQILGIIGLPHETFSPYGANVKTSILFARKWRRGEIKSDKYKLLMGRITNIGYDASGRPKDGADVQQLAKQVKEHIAKYV